MQDVYHSEIVTSSNAPEKTAEKRGRKPLQILDLVVPAFRTMLSGSEISYNHRMRLAQAGLISFIAYREPGNRGRPEMVPVITDRGKKLYENIIKQNQAASEKANIKVNAKVNAKVKRAA